MSFSKFKGFFDSTNGTDTSAYYIYEPDEGIQRRCVIQLVHGMCEYVERYEHFIEYLCAQGYIVVGNDHLGHGNTAKCDNDLGYFAPEMGWTFLPKDMRRMTLIAAEKYPDLPLVIFAHSMGSFIARAYMVKYGTKYDGAVLCGTSSGEPVSNAALMLAKTLSLQNGDHYRSEKLENMMSSFSNMRIAVKKTRYDWISRDPEVVAKYITDKLSSFTFTVRGYYDLVMLLDYVNTPDWAQKINKDVPLYLISGTDDPIGNYGKGVQRVYQRLEEAGVADVEMKLYEGARHELINETNREEVFSDINSWIETHVLSRRNDD